MNLVGPINGTQNADNFLNDPMGRRFLSGDGMVNGTTSTFEFWFSVLPGDYNQDGLVTPADQSVAADGNGDGYVDSADVNIAFVNLWTALPESQYRGDYLDDELVSQLDYMHWKATFGNILTNPDPTKRDIHADGNGDGTVDAADYSVWRNNFGNFGAWVTTAGSGGGGGSGGIPLFDPLNVPRVANVTISGSSSPHAPYSFDAHDGSGEQLRTVPVGGADTISITFTEDVNISADTLKLTGLRTANRPALAEFSYDLGTMTATWRFTGWALADHYAISLSDAVTDVEGNRLDGEWTNPASLFTVNPAVSEFPVRQWHGRGRLQFCVHDPAG